jgi:hypothetical protein
VSVVEGDASVEAVRCHTGSLRLFGCQKVNAASCRATHRGAFGRISAMRCTVHRDELG